MATAKMDNASATGKRSVLLVDDHPVLREGLAKLINAEDDLTVCGQAQTPAEALKAIQQLRPDAVVVDLALREGHGLELIKDIRIADRRLPILVFTIFDEPSYAMRALRAGAQGYLTKQETSEQLVAGLRTVLKGEYALSPRFSQLMLGLSSKGRPISTQRLRLWVTASWRCLNCSATASARPRSPANSDAASKRSRPTVRASSAS